MKVPFHAKAKKRVLKKGKFLSFVSKGGWEYVERSNCTGAVIILAMTDDMKVIFVEQFRPPVGKNVIEFPAGLVGDEGSGCESVARAAKRELLEEAGYRAARIETLLKGPAASGISADMLTMVRAHGLTKVGIGGGIDYEQIKVHEVPLDEVEEWFVRMRRLGKFIGPRLYTGLYFLHNYNKNHCSRKKANSRR